MEEHGGADPGGHHGGATALTMYGLAASGAYTDVVSLVRKGFVTVISAHSGTGFGLTSGTLLLPESALNVASHHSGRRRILRAPLVRSATVVLLLYSGTYLVGGIVGLSVGIVDPSMPTLQQLTYILQMWLGRLEFLAAFAMVGYLVSLVRGRR